MDTTVDAPGADGDPSPGPRVAPTPRRRQNMSRGKPRMSHKEPCGSRRAWGDDDVRWDEYRAWRSPCAPSAACGLPSERSRPRSTRPAPWSRRRWATRSVVARRIGRPLSDSTGRTMILDVSLLVEPMGAFSWPRAPVRGRALTRSWRRSGRGGGRYPAYTMRGPYRDRPRGQEASSRDRASRQNVRWNGESDVESPTSSPARPDRCTPRTTSGARGPPP